MNCQQPQRRTGLSLACAAAALMIPRSAAAHAANTSGVSGVRNEIRVNDSGSY